ncbi:hypothetical protein AVEN_101226-1 [Araneus ventricosus]|uniref:Uncharacterized protein n=1 Tax=Araneus ventricosus TaxID=182803 RepID=A0A4Y2PC72_ARAVE|nr:hypothetical protein AVEN_101226-1 [Araneus ventricosus]
MTNTVLAYPVSPGMRVPLIGKLCTRGMGTHIDRRDASCPRVDNIPCKIQTVMINALSLKIETFSRKCKSSALSHFSRNQINAEAVISTEDDDGSAVEEGNHYLCQTAINNMEEFAGKRGDLFGSKKIST